MPVYATPLQLTDVLEEVVLNPHLQHLPDPSHALGIEQVSSAAYRDQFTPNVEGQTDFGRADLTWWFRVEIASASERAWYLIVDFPPIVIAEAFIITADGRIHPLGNMRERHTNIPTTRLPLLRPSEPVQVYLRLSNRGKERLEAPIKLLTADVLQQKTNHTYFIYGGISIALLVLAAYNLSLFFVIRQRSYLTLAAMLVVGFLVSQRTSHTLPFLFFLNTPAWFPLILQLFVLLLIQAWRDLAESQTLFPQLDRLLKWPLIVGVVMSPFMSWLPVSDVWVYLWSAFFIAEVILIYIIAFRLKLLTRAMQYLWWAQTLLIVCYFPTLLWVFGTPWLDINIAAQFAYVGILLMGIALSLIQAEHTRQLRLQAERAEASNQAKSEFLSTMSHELRTPMNTVISAGTLLKMTPLSAQQRDYVNKQEAASRHMLGLINNVLDLARIDSRQLPLETVPFRVQDILQHLEYLLGDQARQKHLALYLHPPTSLSEHYLLGDPTRLTQVLVNLVDNAIKFTHQGNVSVYATETWTTPQHVCITFSVHDTGIGIAPEQQAQVFQPFTQASRSTAREYGGSGLGLSISHKLVANMGGTLTLHSYPTNGSVFSFTLAFAVQPLIPAIAEPSHPSIQTEVPQHQRHILLVDDDALNRFFGQELLQALGFCITTANSGTEALNQLQQHTPDLVFMDVSMPEMDGYETTRQIRALFPAARLPIVALTAHAIPGERERCLAAGMNDYLTKPFDLEQLRHTVDRWVG